MARRPTNNNKESVASQARMLPAARRSAGGAACGQPACGPQRARRPGVWRQRSAACAAGRVEPLQAAIVAGLRVGACRRLGGALRPHFAPLQTCACRAPASPAATTPTAPPVLLDGPGAAPASRAASLMVLGKFENLTQRAVRRASRGHSRGRDKPQGPLARAHARARVVCLKKYKEV